MKETQRLALIHGESPFRASLFCTMTEERMLVKEEKLEGRNAVQGTSLKIFTVENPMRRALASIVANKAFDYGVTAVIALSTLFVAFDRPDLEERSPNTAKTLEYGSYCFTVVFVLEIIFRSIAYGFVNGDSAYLASKWNRFDFVVVLGSILGSFVEAAKPVRALRAMRLLLRLPRSGVEHRMTVTAMWQSTPSLGNVCLVSALIGSIFAILGVQLFKGAFGQCSDGNIRKRQDCVGLFNSSTVGAFGPEWSHAEREWQEAGYSFDNIFAAIRTLAWVAIGEDWSGMMYTAVDTEGEDLAPKTNGNPVAFVYFIFWVVIGQFFLLNLFVGVLIDGIQRVKSEVTGQIYLTNEQRDYLVIERLVERTSLARRVSPMEGCFGVRELCHVIVTAQADGVCFFEVGVAILIGLNTVALTLQHDNQSKEWDTALSMTDWVFVGLFTLEALIKCTAHSFAIYIRDPWNRFDALIITISWLGQLMQSSTLGLFRVARFVRLINISESLQTLFFTVTQSLESLLNASVFLIVVMFMFAVFGVQICGPVSHNDDMTDNLNFDGVGQALITLYTIATTEGWISVMEGCKGDTGHYRCKGDNCGATNAIVVEIYFTLFVVVVGLIVINLFVTVLLESFNEIGQEEELRVKVSGLVGNDENSFVNLWLDEDPEATGRLRCNRFLAILKVLGYPYWREAAVRGRPELNTLLLLRRLPLAIGLDKNVRYRDAVSSLAMVLSGLVTDHGVHIDSQTQGAQDYMKQRAGVLCIHHWFAVNLIQKHWVFRQRDARVKSLLRQISSIATEGANVLNDQQARKEVVNPESADAEETHEDHHLLKDQFKFGDAK